MDELSFSLYLPLVFVGLAFIVLYIVSQVLGSRGNPEQAERMLDISFGLALLAAVYTVLLLLIAVVSEPDVIYDLLSVVLIMTVFFGVLLLVLFGLFELFFSRGERRPSPGEDTSG